MNICNTPSVLVRTTMNWDQQQSLMLIAELQKNEILWNPKDKAFFNSQRKEEAWKKLAETLNAEVGEVKRKVDSLRGSYRRERSRMKKAQDAVASGVGDGVYISNWFAFDAMKFLDGTHDSSYSRKKDPLLDFFEAADGEGDSPEYYQTEMNPDPFVTPMQILKKKRSSSNSYSATKTYKLQKSNVANRKDECAIYGEYIAEKLRKLDEITRAQAEHKINNILFEVEMEFFKRTQYAEASTSEVTDTITFDNALSPFQPSPKIEGDYEDEEDDECNNI